jgi:hypothetical protein
MKTYLMLLTVLAALLATLSASPAMSSQDFHGLGPSGPIRVTVAGGGCSNCICETFYYEPCNQMCAMPLSATVENKSNSAIIVKVTLAILLPEGIKPECPSNDSDKQILYYVIPHKGRVVSDFSHVFVGPFSEAEFRATAEVVWSEAGGLVGKQDEASLEVSTTWPMCPSGPRGNCLIPH